MKSYIAAGFDPARFWELTPRLYAVEMEGAADRGRIDRALVWWGAMMPHLKKRPNFGEFVGRARDRASDLRACIAAWDRIDRALLANRKTGK